MVVQFAARTQVQRVWHGFDVSEVTNWLSTDSWEQDKEDFHISSC
jgi:hypothetical protein